jgi:hypothetical protein
MPADLHACSRSLFPCDPPGAVHRRNLAGFPTVRPSRNSAPRGRSDAWRADIGMDDTCLGCLNYANQGRESLKRRRSHDPCGEVLVG